MSWLLDTNVVSELRKGARCNRHVAAWFSMVAEEDIHLSALVVGELRRGVESIRLRDRHAALALDRWLGELVRSHAERILPVDQRVAEEWGRCVPDPVPTVDGLLAATARVHGLTLVTRNVKDVKRTGVRVHDPFAPT